MALVILIICMLRPSKDKFISILRKFFFAKIILLGYYFISFFEIFALAHSFKCLFVSTDELKKYLPPHEDGVSFCLTNFDSGLRSFLSAYDITIFATLY